MSNTHRINPKTFKEDKERRHLFHRVNQEDKGRLYRLLYGGSVQDNIDVELTKEINEHYSD